MCYNENKGEIVMDKKEYIDCRMKEELDRSRRQAPFRIASGKALLDNDELKTKWESFVHKSTEGFECGVLIDETIQIMALIKAGVPTKEIQSILKTHPNKGTIITYLGAFVHPEIIMKITGEEDIVL